MQRLFVLNGCRYFLVTKIFRTLKILKNKYKNKRITFYTYISVCQKTKCHKKKPAKKPWHSQLIKFIVNNQK